MPGEEEEGLVLPAKPPLIEELPQEEESLEDFQEMFSESDLDVTENAEEQIIQIIQIIEELAAIPNLQDNIVIMLPCGKQKTMIDQCIQTLPPEIPPGKWQRLAKAIKSYFIKKWKVVKLKFTKWIRRSGSKEN